MRQWPAATILLVLSVAVPADATEWFVAAGGTGPGSALAPFGRIQRALNAARPGDTVTVRAGTYHESLRTVRHGAAGRAIVLRADGPRGSVVVTTPGRVLTINHAFYVVENLVLDGQYGAADAVRVGNAAHAAVLRNLEIRHSKHDLLDIEGPSDVVVEGCLLHHALNAADGRTDAHGIAAGAVQRLVVRDTEIHTFSGDGIQLDPDRAAPGWKEVTLENLRIWLEPLPAPTNGFAAGAVPGENALDTKASADLPRATLRARNVTAWGFRGGLATNGAAFNLKEHIDATLDGVTVYSSDTAFRLRGGGVSGNGAWVTVQNALVYDVSAAVRYEDNLQNLRFWHNTIGAGVRDAFVAAESVSTGLDVRNVLFLGARPPEASDPSNMTVAEDTFADVARHDYRLKAGARPIDAGVPLGVVTIDRRGARRPIGMAPDVGAYEWRPPTGQALELARRRLGAIQTREGVHGGEQQRQGRRFRHRGFAHVLVEDEEERHRTAAAEEQLTSRSNLKRDGILDEPVVVMEHVQPRGRDPWTRLEHVHWHVLALRKAAHLFADEARAVRHR
jgi:hypothetical protein